MTAKPITQKDVHDVVFLAIMDCKNGGPFVTDIDAAHRIGDAAFHALKEKGLLKETVGDC
jgi:hypothetical protein